MATIKQLSDGGPDGVLFGQSSTDKIGFYGLTTPIARPTATLTAETTTKVAAVISGRLNNIIEALVNLNLIATATA